ncbi:MAG: LapA family protein, partial [Candidatus Binatia bacterium]
ARELHSQRELAEHAEISRIQDLRSFLESQLKTFGQQAESSQAETSARLDRLENELRQSIEQCHNSLAASLAEIDDRLEHGAGDSQARKLT